MRMRKVEKWGKWVICMVAGVLVLSMSGCGRLRQDAARGDATTEKMTSGWGTTGGTTRQEPSVDSSTDDSYAVTSVINGSVIQAEKGKSSFVVSEQRYVRVKETSTSFLPDLAAWSGGAVTASSVTEENGQKTQYFFADNSTDLAIAEEYLMMLSQNYGVVYSEPDGISDVVSDYTVWNLTFPEGSGTMSRYTSLSSNFVSLEYPAAIGLIDTGARQGGETVAVEDVKIDTNTVLADYERDADGYDVFRMKGWNSDESIMIKLYASEYEKGDVFTLEDFKNQVDAGDSAILSCFVTAERVFGTAFSMGPSDSYADRYTEVRVEVLDKTESVIVLYYYFLMNDEAGDLYAYEGVVAAEAAQASGGNENGNMDASDTVTVPAYSGNDRCSYCQGRGYEIGNCIRCHGTGGVDCTYCMAGLVDCTKCGGRGTIYDMVSNSETECFTCHHSGKVDCWKCNGSGSLTCTNCNGTGHAECSHCHGSGKK